MVGEKFHACLPYDAAGRLFFKSHCHGSSRLGQARDDEAVKAKIGLRLKMEHAERKSGRPAARRAKPRAVLRLRCDPSPEKSTRLYSLVYFMFSFICSDSLDRWILVNRGLISKSRPSFQEFEIFVFQESSHTRRRASRCKPFWLLIRLCLGLREVRRSVMLQRCA